MATTERTILLCQSFRAGGDPKGICHKQTDGFCSTSRKRSSTAASTVW